MADLLNSLYQCLLIFLSLLKELFKKLLPTRRKNINGKLVLITGAGGGIGRQLALKFAAQKTKLALVDIDKTTCEETARQAAQMGATCQSYVCDVSRKENVVRMASMVRQDLGEVDILVNNAGICNYKGFLNLKENDVTRIIGVNLLALFWTTQEFLPEMYRKNDGHIVNVSSIAGCLGMASIADYCATKFGVRGLSESLAEDFIMNKKTGVHMSIVYPTAVDTPMLFKATFAKMILPTLLTAEKAADTILEGVLANKKHIFIPNNLWIGVAMNSLFPEETMKIVRTFDDIKIVFD